MRYRRGMSHPTVSTSKQSYARRLVTDLFIAAVLAIFALDTMPVTPRWIRSALEPLLDATGLWQGSWSLFAPIPDSRNQRIRADFYYADGTHTVWNSPEPWSQSAWQRFTRHRESEFLERVWEVQNSAAWPGFAQSLLREERLRQSAESRLSKMELSVIYGDISPPTEPWQPASSPVLLDQQQIFFTMIFPDDI